MIEKKYIPTIGLEIHTELNTKTKMFCGCKNNPFESEPNSNVCPVCLGLPGSLPVPNRQAILNTIKIGQALESKIATVTKWDRKHYFYPDLPKNFQISQFDQPICDGGFLELANGKKIALTRVHLEEDTAKLTHPAGADYSLIDYNRAGVPLVELVTEPVIENAKDAKEFCELYQLALRYLGVSQADMEKGEMRCEVNISLSQNLNLKSQSDILKFKSQESDKLGTKVEIKNLNSFRSVERAIEYEIKRQSEILEKGGKIEQETRGWNDSKQKTFSQRVKETSADYRYFPEPDIPPIETESLQKEVGQLPEMPWEKIARLEKLGVTAPDARIIVSSIEKTRYFDNAGKIAKDKKVLAKMLINEAADLRVLPSDLAQIANLLSSQKINSQTAKQIISGIYQGKSLANLLKQYQSVIKDSELKKVVQDVVANNPQVVEKIKNGKGEAIQFLIGCVMRETRGQAEAGKITELIKKALRI